MRQYLSECKECGEQKRVVIKTPPYPEVGETFKWHCDNCNKETDHQRIEPTQKAG